MILVFQIYFSINMIAFIVTSVKMLNVMIIIILKNDETILYFKLLCNLNLAYNIISHTVHTVIFINFDNSSQENIKLTIRFRIQIMKKSCLICIDSINFVNTKFFTQNTTLLTFNFLAC